MPTVTSPPNQQPEIGTTADHTTSFSSRPATTATTVTFDSPAQSTSQLQSGRNSLAYNIYGEGTYSVSASARTSYTRVDTMEDVREPTPSLSEVDRTPRPPPQEFQIPHTPQVSLTFLLVSGSRRSMSFDPTLTVGRVKELIWNTWPGDSEDERPPAPSFLRLLHLGKILQDEEVLKDVPFPSDAPSTIVHMSIRPGALCDDIAKKGDSEEETVCCCIIC